jgi:hypothetical protein
MASLGVSRMQVNWSRGFFQGWLVFAVAWVGFIGWYEYANKSWNLDWDLASIRTDGECWTRLAKWPNGQHFDEFDLFFQEADTPSNVEINKKNGAWAADSIPERNRWIAATTQKLIACEAVAPVMQRLSNQATNVWASEKDAIVLLLLPPVALLIVGCIIGWIVRGFRGSAEQL